MGYDVCQAMKDANISDPESQEGIDFCLEKCPYPECAMVSRYYKTGNIRRVRRKKARELQAEGLIASEIAVVMELSKRTIERYLR